MLSLNVLYYALAVGFLVLVGFFSYVLYQLGQTLEILKKTVEEIEEIVSEIVVLKNSFKLGILGLVSRWLNCQEKGGGRNEPKR